MKLIGTKSNRAAIGARVSVSAGNLNQIKEVRGGGSYLSQNDLRLHFGLDGNAKINTLEIEWPSGTKQTLRELAADFAYTIEESYGVRIANPLAKPAVCNDTQQSSRPDAPAN